MVGEEEYCLSYLAYFFLCGDLKFWLDVFHSCHIFKKIDQTKMFQMLLYTLSNLFNSTNLIKLIWPCVSNNFSIVDLLNQLRYFIFLKDLYLNLLGVNSFVQTCISVNLSILHHLLFRLIFSYHSIRIAYLGFHTPLYFEHQVFLALDSVFSYYHKGTQRNQNKAINDRNILPFH